MSGKVRPVTLVPSDQVQQMVQAKLEAAAQVRAVMQAADRAAAARRGAAGVSPDVRDGRMAVPPSGGYGKA